MITMALFCKEKKDILSAYLIYILNQARYWRPFVIVPFGKDLRELQRAVGHGGDEVERGGSQVSRVHELI